MHPLIYIDLPYVDICLLIQLKPIVNSNGLKIAQRLKSKKCVTNHFLPYIRFRNDYLSLKILT